MNLVERVTGRLADEVQGPCPSSFFFVFVGDADVLLPSNFLFFLIISSGVHLRCVDEAHTLRDDAPFCREHTTIIHTMPQPYLTSLLASITSSPSTASTPTSSSCICMHAHQCPHISLQSHTTSAVVVIVALLLAKLPSTFLVPACSVSRSPRRCCLPPSLQAFRLSCVCHFDERERVSSVYNRLSVSLSSVSTDYTHLVKPGAAASSS